MDWEELREYAGTLRELVRTVAYVWQTYRVARGERHQAEPPPVLARAGSPRVSLSMGT